MDAARHEMKKLEEMLDPESEVDFAQVERRCRKGAHRMFGSLLADFCQRLDTPLPKHARCPHCKAGTLRSDGRRSKLVITTLGGWRISRRRYRCDRETCRKATYPLDWKLDLQRDRWSPELRAAIVSGRHLGRVAQREGAAMEEDRRRREPTPTTRVEPVMHGSIDGTAAPMKPSQVEGRKGRGADGKARSREAKLLSFHLAKPQEDGSFRMFDKTLCGAIESGFDRAKVQVVTADGASWIWNAVAEQFPRAVQILDLYHVRERLVEVAKMRQGSGSSSSSRRQEWVRSRLRRLKRGRLDDVLSELDRHADCAASKTCARYFRNQRSRMDYPRYRRNGWCCSSAVIESACKHIVGGRVKGSGRRWSVDGANAMIALRCAHENNQANSFHERRHRENVARLEASNGRNRQPPKLLAA